MTKIKIVVTPYISDDWATSERRIEIHHRLQNRPSPPGFNMIWILASDRIISCAGVLWKDIPDDKKFFGEDDTWDAIYIREELTVDDFELVVEDA